MLGQRKGSPDGHRISLSPETREKDTRPCANLGLMSLVIPAAQSYCSETVNDYQRSILCHDGSAIPAARQHDSLCRESARRSVIAGSCCRTYQRICICDEQAYTDYLRGQEQGRQSRPSPAHCCR